MYPVLWTIFGYPISTFGVMMALGFLAATSITQRRMQEEGLDPELSTTMLLYCMLGGVVGAKLYYTIDEGLRTGAPLTSLLFSRSGLTWYGGFMGAVAAAVLGCRIHGLSVRRYLDSAAVGTLVGQALGRVGCLLVGDDYGRQTDLPWGIAFPQGSPPIDVPVHPTQIYEAVWLVLGAVVLWRRRKASPSQAGEYLVWNGVGRFFVEILRVNDPVLLGLTEPQLIGIALVVLGTVTWGYYRSRQPALAP